MSVTVSRQFRQAVRRRIYRLMETDDLKPNDIYIKSSWCRWYNEKVYEEQKELDTYLMKSEMDIKNICSWNTFYFIVSSCYCCHPLQIFIWSPYSTWDPLFCMHHIYFFSECSFCLFCLISTASAVSMLNVSAEQLSYLCCSSSSV